MGKLARSGVVGLMLLAIAVARLVEVELADAKVPPPSAAIAAAPLPPQPAPSPAAQPAPAPAPAESAMGYIVKPGDNLGSISKKAYGTTRHWQLILEANRDVIPDPKRMRAGVRLKLPALRNVGSRQ